jgi:hypothetical protein
MRKTTLTLAVLALSLPALAESKPPSVAAAAAEPAATETGGAFVAGLNVGGLISLGGLRPNAGGSVDVGALLPWGGRSLGLLLSVGYAQPGTSGTVTDPRVPGGAYTWQLTQQQLTLAPTVMYRLTGLGIVVPYVAASFKVFLLQQTVSGSADGQPISPTVERDTRYGVGGRLGAEFTLGPGGVTVEGLFEWGRNDTTAAGLGTQLTGVTVALGYRLIL